MADNTIRVEGLNRLVRVLRDLNPELVAELKAGNRELAARVAAEASSKAPRRSGELAVSIRAGVTQRSGVVRAGKAKVPYAGPIHFGWPRRNITPNPFLWEALDARRTEIEREYLERVTRIVERARAHGA